MQQGPQDGFNAFMDSPGGLPGMHHDPAGRLAAHAAALQPAQTGPFGPTVAPELTSFQAQPAPEMNNWAADFSKFAAQQPRHPQPQQQQQQRQGPMFAGAANPMQMNFQSAFSPQQSSYSPFFAPAGGAYAQPQQAPGEDFDQEMAKWMANNTAGGNMEQVDAAMEQMARELELNEAALAEPEAATAETTDAATANKEEERHFSDLGVPEFNSLSLENREAPTVTPPEPLQEENTAADLIADDARNKSAVSEAAERLLESVQHESGEKWQNSVFLALMRDFRDGRKDIVGNEVQQTDGVEGAPATQDGAGGEGAPAQEQAPAAT